MYDTHQIGVDTSNILPLIVIWATACVVLLGDTYLWRRSRDLSPLVSLGGVVVALAVTLQQAGEPGLFAYGASIRVDALGSVAGAALLVTALLSILMAWTYLKNRGLDYGEYYVLLLLSVSGAMLMAMANDLIMVFLGLEVLSFALYVMAGFARTEAKSEEASVKYFLLGAFASAFFLYGIALTYGATGTTLLADIAHMPATSLTGSPMLLVGIALMLVGLGFKAAVIPFHQWTPDVYEGSPTSVTAYMAGAAKIGAFAAILRVFDSLVGVQGAWLHAIQLIAVLTMVFGNILAVTQSNVKRMLAYSSIAHAGYLLVAVAALSHGPDARPLAWSGALFYLFAYTFMTLGAFGVLVYLSNRGRDYQNVRDLTGLVRHDAWAGYAMMFFMLSLGGIPPTMGFWGKWQIFLAALSAGEVWLAVVMALASAISVYYYLRIVWIMCFEEPTEAAPARPIAKWGATASVFIAAAATIVFGIVPGLLGALTRLVR